MLAATAQGSAERRTLPESTQRQTRSHYRCCDTMTLREAQLTLRKVEVAQHTCTSCDLFLWVLDI